MKNITYIFSWIWVFLVIVLFSVYLNSDENGWWDSIWNNNEIENTSNEIDDTHWSSSLSPTLSNELSSENDIATKEEISQTYLDDSFVRDEQINELSIDTKEDFAQILSEYWEVRFEWRDFEEVKQNTESLEWFENLENLEELPKQYQRWFVISEFLNQNNISQDDVSNRTPEFFEEQLEESIENTQEELEYQKETEEILEQSEDYEPSDFNQNQEILYDAVDWRCEDTVWFSDFWRCLEWTSFAPEDVEWIVEQSNYNIIVESYYYTKYINSPSSMLEVWSKPENNYHLEWFFEALDYHIDDWIVENQNHCEDINFEEWIEYCIDNL